MLACEHALRELQLGCLTELTRLVLKGHADYFPVKYCDLGKGSAVRFTLTLPSCMSDDLPLNS